MLKNSMSQSIEEMNLNPSFQLEVNQKKKIAQLFLIPWLENPKKYIILTLLSDHHRIPLLDVCLSNIDSVHCSAHFVLWFVYGVHALNICQEEIVCGLNEEG